MPSRSLSELDAGPAQPGRRRLLLIPVAAALAVLVPLGWWWWTSLTPSSYSVMSMGYMDYGGGATGSSPMPGMTGMPGMTNTPGARTMSVASLTGPATGTPDVAVQLVARRQRFTLASGQRIEGYTLNGSSPGPLISAHQGDLVQVRLVNSNVTDGVTLHWHGVDVPNAEDGVAGVTQDAVPPGGRHVYRFVVKDAGTYWYHSHQDSADQVKGGLLGPLVVQPRAAAGAGSAAVPQTVAIVHTYDGLRTVSGRTGVQVVPAPAGSRERVRLINTDNGPLLAWVTGSSYRVLAVDGHDLNGPATVTGRTVEVPAGGRYDLEVTVPAGGQAARVDVGGGTALIVGPDGARPPAAGRQPTRKLDLLSYGTPVALPFDPSRPDRSFQYRIGRRPGLIDGRPGFWWTVNGHLFPDVPMFMVGTGDVVRMTISNSSGQMHPMHLHGHHAVVLSRDGVRATGSPWWVDSLDVADGQSYQIAFVADNPGIWMDHCHNLDHAAQGLLAHFAYEGISEPYSIGRHVTGAVTNNPE